MEYTTKYLVGRIKGIKDNSYANRVKKQEV